MKPVSKKTTSVGCGLSTPVFLKSKYCGFCSGVKRAIRIASQAAKNNCAVYTLGDIIHNHQVVEKLKKNNIISISSTSSLKNATLIIPSHGIPLRKESEFKKQGFEVIDATCPKVKRAQKILENLAEEFSIVFIVGLKTHPEVKGILSRSKGKGRVISSITEAAKISPFDNAGVIAQTTFREEKFFKIVTELLKKARVLKIYNTICEETISRQKELKKIAASVDFLFVVGGKNSSNTKRLYEVGRRLTDTHHIETPDDINWTLLNGKKKIGIVTGASTPLNIVKKIEKKIIKRGK